MERRPQPAVTLALFFGTFLGFYVAYYALLPSGIPASELPAQTKLMTLNGVLGGFLVLMGVAGSITVAVRCLRRGHISLLALLGSIALVIAGGLLTYYYWHWLTSAGS